MAGPLRPNPLELNRRWNVGKKCSKKISFFLNGPAIKKGTFFGGFPKEKIRKAELVLREKDKHCPF